MLTMIAGGYDNYRVVSVAARNNAEWCDLVCRWHGLSTRFDTDVWVSQRRSPPAYPDAVTLTTSARPRDVLDAVDGSAGCSVKDSFASLDLSPYGFRVLFEARWIRRPPRPLKAEANWRAVRTAEQLRAWGAAHGGGDVFRPGLLAHPAVTVLAAYDDETVVGGAIANRSGGGVVGISNVFGIWASAAGAVSAHHPGLEIVGYEAGGGLAAARDAGFVESGPLRVWLRG